MLNYYPFPLKLFVLFLFQQISSYVLVAATFSLYTCNSMSKSCISDITYVINVKLVYRVKQCFEEHSLIKKQKLKSGLDLGENMVWR